MSNEAIDHAVSDKAANCRAYHSLCYALASISLSEDLWEVACVCASEFEPGVFGVLTDPKHDGARRGSLPEGVAFTARRAGRRVLFCFDAQDDGLLRRVAKGVAEKDGMAFKTICVMVTRSFQEMNRRRQVKAADQWPRGFFVCFEELRYKCQEINPAAYRELCAPMTAAPREEGEGSRPHAFAAEVLRNVRVGKEGSNHYKLRFRASELQDVIPGQFVMMDTRPGKRPACTRSIAWRKLKSSPQPAPESYLKRPFGIHRAFYPHFDPGYLKRLRLLPELAPIVHTVLPHEFDILYKVIERGLGTHELTRLEEGDKVKMIGPLGRRFDLRQLRTEGVEEVHVIGGGVGMAPLVFMVQALRFFAFDVKAFIGIESVDLLKQGGDLARSYMEHWKNAYVYVDDLGAAGLTAKDISASCDKLKPGGVQTIRGVRFHEGLVSEQYRAYLERRKEKPRAMAFACGPWAMLKAVAEIAEEHDVPLKVLMETRMACGIGVCLSCVCKTKAKDGQEQYTRVCTDGPIFDASEIVWTETPD